ncbi:MAG TPA: septum site-determining protein MinC, partial [Promineifilum sp.]|nr:septum site-determining protein MinC [Promineifilum sp.]
SGRLVWHEGHVVVLGDVNPGAQIVATGNVIVWGRLRGLVHAGASGDATAIICALDLSPTQLRIADHIAVAPNDSHAASIPEQATIREGQIVAEPWRH